jgi:hypothetical protein
MAAPNSQDALEGAQQIYGRPLTRYNLQRRVDTLLKRRSRDSIQ